jgi:hypothetical protein
MCSRVVLMDRKKTSVMRIPLEGPSKPLEIVFDMGDGTSITEYMFPMDGNCINICRRVNDRLTCAICMEECQEEAGKKWYGILGWKGCHMRCWKDLAMRYHYWLNNRENNLTNFCKFIG